MYINNDLQELFEKYYDHVMTSLAIGENPMDIEKFNKKLEQQYDEELQFYKDKIADYELYLQACQYKGVSAISFNEFFEI